MNKSPRAVAVEAMPLNPAMLTVPGDETTPAGSRYAATYGNDYRQLCDWSPKHELQLLHLMATAKPFRIPYMDGQQMRHRVVNVPAETVAVFLQSVAKQDADSKCFVDENGNAFDIVTDDGRQRRLDAVVGNKRLQWIRDTFVSPLWSEMKDPQERRVALRNRLLEYGTTAKFVDGADPKTLPPVVAGAAKPQIGDLIAPWLTEAFVNVIVGAVSWFNDDGDVISINLRPDVRGEDVDMAGDHRVLLNNIRGKEASVPTPLAVKALQYDRLLSSVNEDGEKIYTAHSLSQELGCSADTINNAIYYLEIVDEVREAIDAERVSLKLVVTGRECICYGFDSKGRRTLLSRDQQLAIWGELLKAFAVEAGDGGIPDNASTRAVLKKIKAEILEGTAYVDGLVKRERETKSVVASRAAAERAGVTDFDVDTKTSLKSAAAKASRDEDAEDDDYDGETTSTTKPEKKSKPSSIEAAPQPNKSAPISIRAALATKAKALKLELDHFHAEDRDADEDGLVLAVADAVSAVHEGADASKMFARFPVLLEAVAVGGGKSRSGKGKAGKSSAASPFKRQDQVKEIVDAALSLWEAEGAKTAGCSGDAANKAVSKHINAAAVDVCGENVETDMVLEASLKLHDICVDYDGEAKMNPHGKNSDVAGHIREVLFS